jgi:hypothetical protein
MRRFAASFPRPRPIGSIFPSIVSSITGLRLQLLHDGVGAPSCRSKLYATHHPEALPQRGATAVEHCHFALIEAACGSLGVSIGPG